MPAGCLLAALVVAPSLRPAAFAAKYQAGQGAFISIGGAPGVTGEWSAANAGQVCPGPASGGPWLLESGILVALRHTAGITFAAALPESVPEASALTLTAEVRAQTPPDQVTLHWRAAGELLFTASPMSSQGGSTYRATIPAEPVTLRGLELYFETAADGRTARWPATAPTTCCRIPVVVTEATGGGDLTTRPESYRMLSLPAVCPDGAPLAWLEDDLGSPDREVWRFGRWNPSAQRYREHGVDGVEPCAPGRAYWLITAAGESIDFSGRTAFPPPGEAASISLAPGWNQIGSPFAFPIALTGLRVRSGDTTFSLAEAAAAGLVEASPLHEYDGSGYAVRSQLTPWTGYFVANLHSQPIDLLIPMQEATPAPATRVDPLDWSARLLASARGQHAGLEIGASPAAAAGWDPWDELAPPPPPVPFLRLYSANEQLPAALAALSRDVRPGSIPGTAWEITLEPAGASTVELQWEPVGLPEEFEARLVAPQADSWVDLSSGSARLAPAGSGRYRLLVGRRDWIEDQTGVGSVPLLTTIALDGPNPSRGSTRGWFSLTTKSHTSLHVCDLAGREVRELAVADLGPGRHRFHWDGRNGSDQPAPAGVYFIRLAAEGRVRTTRVVLAR